MRLKQQLPHPLKRVPLPVLLLSAVLIATLLGTSLWYGIHWLHETPTQPTQPPTNEPLSPLLFGTNLGLFDSHDQVLNSAPTRALLQQIHTQIIRMPIRSNLPPATQFQAAHMIKGLGMTPLIILRGAIDANVLADNLRIITTLNDIFGTSTVYYEYGNEEDLAGIPVERYTASWNTIVPQLKKIAPHGQFIGPVNFQYNSRYLTSFLQHARPQPDEISWHEYTCDVARDSNVCISRIARWTNHIADARAAMRRTVGKTLPIMITEWNYAPNAFNNDGKNNDSAFMNAWTTKALQTLAANRVFASMQYSCTNTAIPLITSNDLLTTQGSTFRDLYQHIILQRQSAPSLSLTELPATPTPPQVQMPSTKQDKPIFTFEDGTTEGWSGHGQQITALQNSTTATLEGKHALQVTLTKMSSADYPYIFVPLPTQLGTPQAGQTLTAHVYTASNAISLSAQLFVVDEHDQWHPQGMSHLEPGTWTPLTYTVPSTVSGLRQLGIQFSSPTTSEVSSDLFIDAVGWH